MKRLIIKTDRQVIIEYHANKDSALKALVHLMRMYKIVEWAVKDVIRHIELPPNNEPQFTKKNYSDIE